MTTPIISTKKKNQLKTKPPLASLKGQRWNGAIFHLLDKILDQFSAKVVLQHQPYSPNLPLLTPGYVTTHFFHTLNHSSAARRWWQGRDCCPTPHVNWQISGGCSVVDQSGDRFISELLCWLALWCHTHYSCMGGAHMFDFVNVMLFVILLMWKALQIPFSL